MGIQSGTALAVGIVGMSLTFLLRKSNEKLPNVTEKLPSSQTKSVALGIAASLLCGLTGGAEVVPSKYAPYHGIHFVLSFAYGAVVANATFLVCYGIMSAYVWRQPFPSPQFRVMAVPGAISGLLWSLGNAFSLYAVNVLGQGVGFSALQSSVIVGGLWGILFYQQLNGKAMIVWCFFLAICVMGMVGLATQKLSFAEEEGLRIAVIPGDRP